MEGIWDKITGKDDHKDAPHQSTTQMTSATNPVATEAQTRTNPIKQDNPSSSPFSFDKLKEALGGHSPAVKTPDLPPPVTVTQVEHSGSQGKDDWHDKVALLTIHQLYTDNTHLHSSVTCWILALLINERRRKREPDLKGQVIGSSMSMY